MSVKIKTPKEIEKMRVAGRLAADVLEMITPYLTVGISTGELNRICHDFIVNKQCAIPAPLNYYGFPASICTSVNEVVCHGIPDDRQILLEGDIVNIDITVIKDGYHADTSKTYKIGKISIEAERLIDIAEECLYEGIRIIRPGIRLGEIGYTIQKLAEKNRYSVVRDFCGHGIGKAFHEDPEVLHYGSRKNGLLLREGMIFTIEPMINIGVYDVVISKQNGWTVTTKDKTLSAQFEHTLLVTRHGCEILTKRSNENI